MSAVRGALSVCRFEWKRSLTIPRIAWWVLLAAFPPAVLALIRVTAGRPSSSEPVEGVVYVLCPCVVCMLGVFLWATPWISSELEGRSWVYLAIRPWGSLSVLLGKYLVAVTWTASAALIATVLSVLIIADSADFVRLIWVQSQLVVLSCLAYAAVFALIGVLFPKRAMVIAVFYAVVLEVALASVPAAVNLVTIQYRLRCIAVRWLHWDELIDTGMPLLQAYIGEESAAWHMSILLAMTAGLLLTSALALRWREFIAEAESDA